MSTAVALSRGMVALIDDEDAEAVGTHKWSIKDNGCGKLYAQRGARDAQGRRTMILLHRAILDPPSGYEVDHINGDGLDCRRCNLRIATPAENRRNTRPKAGSSRFKGVTWHKRTRKWIAQISHAGSNRNLGYFTHEDDAARAYDKAASDVFGEFAYLNFPPQEA